MNKQYIGLKYIGNSKYITLDIYPSKVGVKIAKKSTYLFDDKDVVNDTAIKYYKSLYSAGIRLIDNENSEEITKDPEPQVEAPQVDVLTTSEEEVVTEDPEPTPEVTEIPEEVIKDEEVVKVDDSNLEATTEEMIEFLDLTYDDESIKSVAHESGIKRVSGDKATIINKIIENNPQFVINLIKNQ